MCYINKYFPQLTKEQCEKIFLFSDLILEWNDKINVISRKDTENIELHHIIHSLSISKAVSFAPDSDILDIGTGGGFPGIPLAISFADSRFFLADSISKKINVVKDIINKTNIPNAFTINSRVELINRKFDYIVCRAVASLPVITDWAKLLIKNNKKIKKDFNLFCLKGGDLVPELVELKYNYKIIELADLFDEPFFASKKLICIKLQ
ncbi:MAG: 16S rRNA (guanine(527)-N(7))-methyltransferase RsmG [Bacteroidales bacterium]|nr:16S rRNA (guanine(527)-N(7))-methyltransferase RsmG [Bacteroidales bacterium]